MKNTVIILAILLCVLIPNIIQAQTFGIEPAIGLPRGYMDMSLNGQAFARFDFISSFELELRVQDYFSYCDDSYHGYVFTNVGSIYAGSRIVIADYIEDMTPFITPGVGLHFIYSWATDNPLEHKDRLTITTKAHTLYGMEYELGRKSYLFFQGRITYPSDIIFDSFNFGLGLMLTK